MHRRYAMWFVALLAVTVIGQSACNWFPDGLGGGTTTIQLGPAPVLTLVSGEGQTVQVGSEFPLPVRVRLTTASGEPMPNVIVAFRFMDAPIPTIIGGGMITGRRTNADAIAEIKFTPTRAGTFTVRAYIEECVKSDFNGCVEEVVRAEVTVSGTAVAPGG